ncbi:MAG: anti-virulence regulator CigR family protein [Longimicrobiales bacterium]|nr:anti-virulence regulator CigR family protein [Longimicrobiales bacterium]
MSRSIPPRPGALAALIAAAFLALSPHSAAAQGRGGQAEARSGAGISFTVEIQTGIREFYAARGTTGARTLPPGMRQRLQKGKPLPPGIAKQVAPPALLERVAVPRGYELVEAGVDVLLVEVATGIIHDVLMDVIR